MDARLANAISQQAVYDEGLRTHMTKTYSVLAWGLAVTAAAAWLTASTSLLGLLYDPTQGLTGLGMVVMFAPLAMLLIFSFTGAASRPSSARMLYWAFVAIQGPGIALATMHYAGGSIVQAAAATAATFGAASLYGYTTGRNLDGVGGFLFIGLIGLIVASLINVFFASAAVDFALSVITVVIFTGLAAWETQRLKSIYYAAASEGQAEQARYMAALGLYLDIINIFLALLRLFGVARD